MTGVQTCALPICRVEVRIEKRSGYQTRMVVFVRFAWVACAPAVPPAERLQVRCAGPAHPVRSSRWSRSQGVPGWMGWEHRVQMAWPALTRGSHRRRILTWAVPYPRWVVVPRGFGIGLVPVSACCAGDVEDESGDDECGACPDEDGEG